MMHWNSLSEFFTMGGHGPYVFGAYALVVGALAAEFLALKRVLSRHTSKES